MHMQMQIYAYAMHMHMTYMQNKLVQYLLESLQYEFYGCKLNL